VTSVGLRDLFRIQWKNQFMHFTCAAHSCSDLSWLELFVLNFLCQFSLLVSSRISSLIRFSLCACADFSSLFFSSSRHPCFSARSQFYAAIPSCFSYPRCSPTAVECPGPFHFCLRRPDSWPPFSRSRFGLQSPECGFNLRGE
jgi:hypothetical protein